MATIYHGDFRLLLERGSAYRDYSDAQALLLEAGVAKDRIEQFFRLPQAIPTDRFFSRFDDAVAYQQQNLDQVESIADGVIHLGVFTGWNETVASTRMPVSSNSFLTLELPYNQVDISFNLSSRGKASSIDVLASIPDERSIQRKARRAVREIKMRPSIIEGKAQRLRDVQIRYRYLLPDQ